MPNKKLKKKKEKTLATFEPGPRKLMASPPLDLGNESFESDHSSVWVICGSSMFGSGSVQVWVTFRSTMVRLGFDSGHLRVPCLGREGFGSGGIRVLSVSGCQH